MSAESLPIQVSSSRPFGLRFMDAYRAWSTGGFARATPSSSSRGLVPVGTLTADELRCCTGEPEGCDRGRIVVLRGRLVGNARQRNGPSVAQRLRAMVSPVVAIVG